MKTNSQSRQRKRQRNALSKKHLDRVVKRSHRTNSALESVWGVTWNLRGGTLVPFGKAAMVVMSTHPMTEGKRRSMIELRCVHPSVDITTGRVHYDRGTAAYDFSINPYIGARGRVLDPRDSSPNKRDKPKADLVRLGLELDRHRLRASDQNWKLSSVPRMPELMAGFNSMSAINMEMTPAMMELLAEGTGEPVEVLETRPAADLMTMAKANWPDLWRAPGTSRNSTKYWLIPAKFTTRLNQAKLFEDFSELCGVDIWNPARDLNGVSIANPANACAVKLGTTVETLLAETVKVTETDADSDKSTAPFAELVMAMREHLGPYSDKFSNDEIEAAIADPNKDMHFAVESLCEELDDEDVIKLMRMKIVETRPVYNSGITDEDILKAAANPDAPLHASRVCQFQALFCDKRIDVMERFQFSTGRVSGNLWTPIGAPKSKPASPRKEKNVTETPAPVATA